MEIKKVRIFPNNNKKSKEIEKVILKVLKSKNICVTDEDYDLAIAIGGDGSFLRMVKENNFNSNIFYVGVNTGTLGFLQDITIDEFSDFIDGLKKEKIKYDSIGIQETKIFYGKDQVEKFYSLNEIVIRDKELNTLKIDVNIDGENLEKFAGDGILISTSIGSTAYNMSFHGSIVYSTLHTLQITPIAPLNSVSYRDLLNSVIVPETKLIELVNKNKHLLITIDGKNYYIDNVKKIQTVVDKKRIKCLRPNNYNFARKINDKFLK